MIRAAHRGRRIPGGNAQFPVRPGSERGDGRAEDRRGRARTGCGSRADELDFACAKDADQVLWVFALLTGDRRTSLTNQLAARDWNKSRPGQGDDIAWSSNLHHPEQTAPSTTSPSPRGRQQHRSGAAWPLLPRKRAHRTGRSKGHGTANATAARWLTWDRLAACASPVLGRRAGRVDQRHVRSEWRCPVSDGDRGRSAVRERKRPCTGVRPFSPSLPASADNGAASSTRRRRGGGCPRTPPGKPW